MISFKLWLEKTTSETLDFNAELAFVCPKSKGQSRKWGRSGYLLPHDLQTANIQLLDNPEYYDRCVVYDLDAARDDGMTDPRHPTLQDLKPSFKKFEVTHAELIINYTVHYTHEMQPATYGGEKLVNISPHEVDGVDAEVNDAYLFLYNEKGTRIKELKISGHYAYNLFNVYEEELLNSHLHGSRQDPTTQDPNSWKSGRG